MCAGKRKTQNALLGAFRQQLRNHENDTGSRVSSALSDLVRRGCSGEQLMYAVSAVRLTFAFESQTHGDPARMSRKRLQSLTKKTCQIAREWEQEFQSPFGKSVLEAAASHDLPEARLEYLRLPQKLLSLAAEARDIWRGSSRNRRPMYNDCLAELTEYVKLKTCDYHDREVSELVEFATGKSCDENTLRVWRNKHRDALARARDRLNEQD